MNHARVHRIKWIAIAAALLILILGTAVALVQGNVLRAKMSTTGGERLAAQVQDVHMSDADGGFSFAIEEVLCEGEKLLVSYTAMVPEDGRTYLFSPSSLMLNDRRISCDMVLDTEFFSTMYELGGTYGSSVTQIMQLNLEEETLDMEQNLFSCRCVFMETDRPLKKVESEAFYALLTEPDSSGIENQLTPNADTLYYFDTSVAGDPVPVVYLFHYPEVRKIFDAQAVNVLTAASLEETGIAKRAASCEVQVPLEGLESESVMLNDVTQRIHFMDGYSVEIEELSISSFAARFRAIIRPEDDAFTGWTGKEPFGQYYQLCNADGTDFGAVDYSISGADMLEDDNGEMVYCVEGSCGGIFPLDGINEVYLAPIVCDADGISSHRDMSRAIRLVPFSNPERSAPEPETAPDPAETDDLSA